VGDDYLSGLLYSEMGRIYRLYYDYPKSLEAHRKSAECYERAGMIRHRNYMWFNKSSVYRDMNRDDEGEELLKKVLESAKAEDDNTLAGSCKGNLVMLYIKQGKMKDARELYEKWESIVGLQSASSSFMAELALMYAEEGDFIQAQNFIQEGWKHAANRMDSVSLSLSLAKIHYIQGKGMAAYEEVVKGMSLQNRGIRQALQQPVLTAQRDYLSDRLEFQNYKLRMEKHFRILCFLFFVVLLGIVVYVLSKKLKQEKEKARKTIDELNEEMQRKEAESHHKIASLLQELEGKHQSDIIINSLREELFRRDENLKQYICESESIRRDLQHVANENLANASQLYREKMQSMSEMVLKFEEKKDSNIIEEIRWWKNKYLVGRKAIAEMERQVNLYNEDVMLHFRKEVTMSEEKDYHWVCYLFAGVSVKAIAWLLGENKGAIYQRRFRLRSEIEASDYLHKELFLELLDK
jgi:tetratricopeptide (TPR) repeat protein